jgi:hypothetical protein
MIKKHHRVGSLSMGLVLTVSGIIMLISLFAKINVLDILLTFWPVVLICIGAEIILHLFFKKESDDNDRGKIKYDVLSVLFIGFILAVSIGFYTLTYATGFMFETREDMNTAFGNRIHTVRVEGTEELSGVTALKVLDGGFCNARVTVLSSPDSTLKVEYVVSVDTSDRDYARSLLGNGVNLSTGSNGQAYLRFDESRFNSRRVEFPRIYYVIYLPRDVELSLPPFWGQHDYDLQIAEQITHRRMTDCYYYDSADLCDCCTQQYRGTQR